MKLMKQKIYTLLYENERVGRFLYALIVINVIALILESYQEIQSAYQTILDSIEIFSVIIFTIEYFLRIWAADYLSNESSFKSRLKFLFSPLGIIDLLAILPFYLPLIMVIDLRVVKVLRLFRLLRIFKLSRFSKSLTTIIQVFKETKADLIITAFVTFILLVLSSTLMYYFEKEAQPIKFASIGHAFWWSVATLTTVGYGDVYPVTGIGKLLSGLTALIGIGFVALPTGIISSAFMNKLQRRKLDAIECTCPNCGNRFEQTVEH